MKYWQIILVTIVLALSSCSGPPKKFNVNIMDYEKQDTGIVFGRITLQSFGLFTYNLDSSSGRGIGIKNVQTGEKFNYMGAKYFEMMLPPGKYQIYGIGSTEGSLSSKTTPFMFSVKRGAIKYIGSIVGDRDLSRLLEQKGISLKNAGREIISTRKYGPIQFFIVDEDEKVINEFLMKHQEIKKSETEKDFMK